jgi:hypothetical protein
MKEVISLALIAIQLQAELNTIALFVPPPCLKEIMLYSFKKTINMLSSFNNTLLSHKSKNFAFLGSLKIGLIHNIQGPVVFSSGP